MVSTKEEPESEIQPPTGPQTRPRSKMVWAIVIVVIMIIAALAAAFMAGWIGGTKGHEGLVVAMSSDVETMDPSKTSAMYGPVGMVL